MTTCTDAGACARAGACMQCVRSSQASTRCARMREQLASRHTCSSEGNVNAGGQEEGRDCASRGVGVVLKTRARSSARAHTSCATLGCNPAACSLSIPTSSRARALKRAAMSTCERVE
eukprot:2479501-Pleurochrysis_carterae.AAC.7